ncbi:leucine-rich repeat protein [Sodaliphilus sp.]|uniref:leucine-rich repeat protein n=1 Tax=Sodaliphilus sp. TaxID=2815818 RepID=UPI00389054DC
MKKLLSLFVMVAVAVSAMAAVGDIFAVGNLNYKILNNTYVSVVGLSASGKAVSSLALDIPPSVTYSGVKYAVTGINSYAFENATNLTSVTINYCPDGNTIKYEAFKGCKNITWVRIPSSTIRIEEKAFADCTGLKYVYMACPDPDAVDVKNNAFPNNSNMELHIPKAGITGISDAYKRLAAYAPFSVVYMSSDAYDFLFTDGAQMCVTNKPTATEPGEVSMVGYSMSGSTAKDGNFVPACTGTSTGAYGSYGYRYHFVEIARYACQNNKDLKSIDLSKLTKLRSIETNAFYDCTNLTTANINCASLTAIGDKAFRGTGITTIHIPAGLTLGNLYFSAFLFCDNLKSITVSENNNSFSSYNGMVFSKNHKILYLCPEGMQGMLEDREFPGELTEVHDHAFRYTTDKLSFVALPYGVTTIGDGAFLGSEVTTIRVPSSVTKLGYQAFSTTPKTLETLMFNVAEPLSKSSTLFYTSAALTNLIVPYEAVETFKNTEPWNRFTNIKSGAYDILKVGLTGSIRLTHHSGYTVFSTEKQTIDGTDYDGCARLTYLKTEISSKVADVVIGKSVTPNNSLKKSFVITEIGSGVCTDENIIDFSLTLDEYVTKVGKDAFKGVDKLIKLTLGKNVAKIGENAFNGCSRLGEIECKGMTPPNVLDANTFSTYATTTLRVPAAALSAYKNHAVWGKFLHIEGVGSDVKGDVNGDGVADITDTNILINILLGKDSASKYAGADVTGDGVVDIADVNAVLNLILGK